ncbi:methionine--tRNA ligase [Candidatus Woesearchaeota archaeon]|nr:methionine--tRNA ligase [Candidatus Woesearchaeota archaeon]
MVKESGASRKEKILVTAGLPYANGPIHLGHLVEYIQADIFVRFLRLSGKDVIYVCGDDTHGTPIELAAAKEKIAPEELIKRYYDEHTADFASFFVNFDVYHSTNSPENRFYSDLFFNRLNEKGLIQQRLVELTYCENDKRYLPDRYVKGKCPKCGAEDQYGDQCEKCNATYQPVELIEPRCAICGLAPVRKQSLHYFFKLSSFSQQLQEWLDGNKGIQSDVRHFVEGWIKSGLQDWDISRDGPYFGFKIPGELNKYYYVWLDAPIGYIAATEKYCKDKLGKTALEAYWQNPDARIIHFIGKDIIYFHLLFWPAMLAAAGFSLPSDIAVHGHLTVNGEKMSKSRGNFLTAKDYLAVSGHEPEFLRFYYASHLTKSVSDINLDFNDFKEKTNNDLVNNLANFVHRTLVFLNNNFDSKLEPLGTDEKLFLQQLQPKYDSIAGHYLEYSFKDAVRELLELSSIGNRYFQENQPWQLIKTDKKKCHRVVSVAAQIVRDLMLLAFPILPKYSEKILRLFGYENFEHLSFADLGRFPSAKKLYPARIVFAPIEETIALAPVFPAVLKVGVIGEIAEHPDADKLYVLKVDIGKGKPKVIQLVAGLRPYYKKDELLGKKVVVVSNLKHAKLRGYESQGMLLAADDGSRVTVVFPQGSEPGDLVFPEGSDPEKIAGNRKQLAIDEFYRLNLRVKDEKVMYGAKPLKTSKEIIPVDAADDAVVR